MAITVNTYKYTQANIDIVKVRYKQKKNNIH